MPLKGGGSPLLTGDAGTADVVSGKTFYSDNPISKLTGSGANAKKYATGTVSTQYDAGANENGFCVVSGLAFNPNLIIIWYSTSMYAVWKSSWGNIRLIYNGWANFQAQEYVTANSFKLLCKNSGNTNQTVTWEAFLI